MLKVLIVEDELYVRKGIVLTVDWAALDCMVVGEAANGEEGVEAALRYNPQIIVTDIRMPRMDGITMANRIREILPECRIIFLSAYSEIDYYKAAIALKAVRYLDKPIEPELLRAVITEAVAECEQLRRYLRQTLLGHVAALRQRVEQAGL